MIDLYLMIVLIALNEIRQSEINRNTNLISSYVFNLNSSNNLKLFVKHLEYFFSQNPPLQLYMVVLDGI